MENDKDDVRLFDGCRNNSIEELFPRKPLEEALEISNSKHLETTSLHFKLSTDFGKIFNRNLSRRASAIERIARLR